MVNGKNIRKSETNKSCLRIIMYINFEQLMKFIRFYLCNCKKASNFLSSRSNSSNGSDSRKFAIFKRTLKQLSQLFVNANQITTNKNYFS